MPILASPVLARIGIGLGILIALGAAIFFYGLSRYNDGKNEERGKWEAAQTKADKEILRLNVALVTSQLTASQNYAEKLNAQEPIILHDRQTIERFAATPAGAMQCLDADRVRGIEESAAARGIAHPTATAPSNGAVHVAEPPQSR